jgi:hypothetical protein
LVWPRALGGQFLVGSGATRNADGRVEVFGVGTNYHMYHAWQSSGGSGAWSGWSDVGSGFTGGLWLTS